jgi:rare lipoprotein A
MTNGREAQGARREVYPGRDRLACTTPLAPHGIVTAMIVTMALTGCGSAPKQEPASRPAATVQRGGGFYLDDGPGPNPPANLDAVADAVPRAEPLHRGAMRPYTVMGRNYTPMTRLEPYKARGIATWYGRRYHGKPTSSGEPYDMYAMTAAHTVLPIPSYVRVTNPANGRSVVVRVNDRGPFIGERLIDLSYVAAHRLGLLGAGSGVVEVETLLPGVAVAAAPPPTAPPSKVTAKPLAAAAIESAPLPASATSSPSSPTLQFAAFGLRENAESFLSRLQGQLDWLAGSLRIVPGDNVFRVQAGPFASEAAAREAAERAAALLGGKPVLVR